MLHWSVRLFAQRHISQELEQVYGSVQVARFMPHVWDLLTVHILQQAADYCRGQRTRTGHKPCALQECLLASRPHVTRAGAILAPDR